MEVHHHPDVHHKRKQFKEYFLEFLMIFLAVTMGFFAENIREGFADRAKENEFMESMIGDLKADTAATGIAVARWHKANLNLDSILYYLNRGIEPASISSLYGLQRKDFFHFDLFKYSNKTIEELKSSGSFRLIKNKSIADKIMAYDVDMKYILIQEQDVKDFRNASQNLEIKIFDYTELNLDRYIDNKMFFTKKDSTYHLLSYDKRLIGEYYNQMLVFHVLAIIHEDLFKEIKIKATNLLESIHNEYGSE
jgi:hypothetical protein